MQGFEHHVRLLHCFLVPAGKYCSEDPRAQFRRLVRHIMARHEDAFLQRSSASQLTAMAKDIEQFVHVDDVLLKMLKFKHKLRGDGSVWPLALMASLGAVLAQDISSPFGLAAHVVGTTCGAIAGIAVGAQQSASWGLDAAVLTNQALLHDSGDLNSDLSDLDLDLDTAGPVQ